MVLMLFFQRTLMRRMGYHFFLRASDINAFMIKVC
jgi:hypothetical protein